MKKTLLLLVAAIFLIPSCNKDLTYEDGVYTVDFDHYDSHGWKAFLEFTLEGDEVTDVDYDYLDSSQNRKSEDAAYNERMQGIVGTSPEIYLPELETQILNAEITPDFTGIDGVSGATGSSTTLEELFTAGLEAAEIGENSVIVMQSIYVDGTYMAEYDTLDTHGWKAFLEITLEDDVITAADFDYYDADMNRKSEDADYNETMLNVVGTNPQEFSPELEANIMAATIRPRLEGVDTWTGATGSSGDAEMLLEAALEIAMDGDETSVVVPQPDVE